MSRAAAGLTDDGVEDARILYTNRLLRLLGRRLLSVLFYLPIYIFQRSLQVEPGPPKGIPKKLWKLLVRIVYRPDALLLPSANKQRQSTEGKRQRY